MLPEKWENLVGDIKDKFEVEDCGSEHLDERGGVDVEHITFKSPIGRVKLEFTTKPVVLDKKIVFSRRIGSGSGEEYVYSKDEKTSRMTAFKWDMNARDWIEIDADNFK